jgi:hypothetical protein
MAWGRGKGEEGPECRGGGVDREGSKVAKTPGHGQGGAPGQGSAPIQGVWAGLGPVLAE